MTEPVAPTNVRLLRADGTELPLECRYDSLDGEQHVWAVVVPVRFRRGDQVLMDVLPAKTSVTIEVAQR